jgi:two-component system, OmpR family, alkaline phosphatase synthesis response regulator PhoP
MPGKVLIVDDNPDVLALLRMNLQAAGFETAEARNGQVALQKIDLEKPSLILLDLMMPVLDGWGVLERLKLRQNLPPIIVLSAADSPASVDRAQQLGVTAYVTKPFNLVGLVELVQSLTESSDADAAEAKRPSAL